jgi:hypothetical protein
MTQEHETDERRQKKMSRKINDMTVMIARWQAAVLLVCGAAVIVQTPAAFAPHSNQMVRTKRDTHRHAGHERRPKKQRTQTLQIPPTRLGALIPLSVPDLEHLISMTGKPTAAQYTTYWGRTSSERYARFIKSATVGFLGIFFSYFLSFVLRSFVATILGSLFFFWGILSPEFKAYQRNWEFLGGHQLVDLETVEEEGLDPDRAGLYGGLFLGFIADVCMVETANDLDGYDLEEFSDYRMESDERDRLEGRPYLLRLQLADKKGRMLQIHCRLSEEYLDLQPGMPATTMLLSIRPKFDKLAALTDVYVPDEQEGVWIGDYPYLERAELEAMLDEDDEIWDTLQEEATPKEKSSEEFYDKTDPFDRIDDKEYTDRRLVPLRRKRYR